MRQENDFCDAKDIAIRRAQLLTQLRRDERQLRKDTESVRRRYQKLTSVFHSVENVIALVAPRFNAFLTGFSLVSRLFRKK